MAIRNLEGCMHTCAAQKGVLKLRLHLLKSEGLCAGCLNQHSRRCQGNRKSFLRQAGLACGSVITVWKGFRGSVKEASGHV